MSILFEYACPKCDEVIEQYHGMDDKPNIMCPICRTEMYKKMGGTTFVLRGECWAKDGYEGHTKMRRGKEYEEHKAARNAYEAKHGKLGGNNG